MLKLSVRSAFRIHVRENRRRDPSLDRKYHRELCGFNADRWRRLYGKEQFGNGLAEIFSNP